MLLLIILELLAQLPDLYVLSTQEGSQLFTQELNGSWMAFARLAELAKIGLLHYSLSCALLTRIRQLRRINT